MKKIAVLLFLSAVCLLSVAASLHADRDPHEEIVYRTNLGRADDVTLLLKQGISPDEKDAAGVPLIILATVRTDDEGPKVVQVLLDAGADINAKDAAGQTALFYAIKNNQLKTVQFLLSKGADYYAVDNSGATARDYAYMTAHEKIGAAIDDFVKGQAAVRAEEYKKFNEKVAALAHPPQPSPTPTPTPTPTPSPSPSPKPSSSPIPAKPPLHVLTPEEQAAMQEEMKKHQEEIKQSAYDLAFNTCAFEYWSYINDANQSTELSLDGLGDAIDSYKDKATAVKRKLFANYHLSAKFVDNISSLAEQRIFTELNSMPSKSYRHEQGIGQEDDMKSRCHIIATHWNKELAPPPKLPQEKSQQREK